MSARYAQEKVKTMKFAIQLLAAIGAFTLSHLAFAAGVQTVITPSPHIVRAGSAPTNAGSADYFTGSVRIEPVWKVDDTINASGGMVTFAPGARSAWHTHPAGQRLVIISGEGLTQKWGEPVQRLKAGDFVYCPPGVKHWHGASPSRAMSHLAITGSVEGKNVDWLEQVSDTQYSQVPE